MKLDISNLTHDDKKAQAWIDSEIEKIIKEYSLSESKAEDCACNADHCATKETTAGEWIGLFEASIC